MVDSKNVAQNVPLHPSSQLHLMSSQILYLDFVPDMWEKLIKYCIVQKYDSHILFLKSKDFTYSFAMV